MENEGAAAANKTAMLVRRNPKPFILVASVLVGVEHLRLGVCHQPLLSSLPNGFLAVQDIVENLPELVLLVKEELSDLLNVVLNREQKEGQSRAEANALAMAVECGEVHHLCCSTAPLHSTGTVQDIGCCLSDCASIK